MDDNMNLFLQKLNAFIAEAKNKETSVSEEEIRNYFEGIDLDESQLALIYDYIQADEIDVERELQPEILEGVDLNDLTLPEGTADDDPVHYYVEELNDMPEITAETLCSLADDVRNRLDKAGERLVQASQKLVYALARQNTGRSVTIMDLVQEGNIALLMTVKDMEDGADFEYLDTVTERIRMAMEDVIADYSRLEKVPEHIADTMNKIRTVEEILKESGDDPSVEDIAKELSLPVSRVQEIIRLSKED